ncbi:MAG: flagellar hook-associated protein 2 [Clostridiales bacterium]|nr:flagellar hook-associated protein 2 [Clostridiales bacterium]
MPIKLSGMVSNMDTDSIVKELMSAQSMKKTKVENKKTELNWTQEIWKSLNTKLLSFYKGTLSKARTQGSYNTKKASSSDETIVSATASNSAAKGAHSLEVSQLASAQFLTSGTITRTDSGTVASTTKLKDLGFDGGEVITITAAKKASDKENTNVQTITVTDTTTISDFVEAADKAGLNATFDATQKRLFISSEDSGVKQKFTIETTSGTQSLTKLGLGEITGDTDVDTTTPGNTGGYTLVTAKNAKFTLDGAAMEESSNNFTVNFLTLDLKAVTTAGNPVKISVQNDTDSTYKMIKEFVKEFNSLVKEMNDMYYADAAKGYQPLTDEQKKDMTDDEVTKWEKKIKDALLRRDDTVGNLVTTMKASLMQQISVNGTKVSLATFGIKTSTDWTEKGLLHIYGDEDDDTYSTEDNDLKDMLESDPELVMKGMASLAQSLYTTMSDKMAKTSLSSALTFYNDKEMKTEDKDYKTQIKDWNDKLSDLEDRYYKQFTQMEVALSKLQSQSNSLSSLMGTSS